MIALAARQSIVAQGESPPLDLKKSTDELLSHVEP
jgi:hypothetical protein